MHYSYIGSRVACERCVYAALFALYSHSLFWSWSRLKGVYRVAREVWYFRFFSVYVPPPLHMRLSIIVHMGLTVWLINKSCVEFEFPTCNSNQMRKNPWNRLISFSIPTERLHRRLRLQRNDAGELQHILVLDALNGAAHLLFGPQQNGPAAAHAFASRQGSRQAGHLCEIAHFHRLRSGIDHAHRPTLRPEPRATRSQATLRLRSLAGRINACANVTAPALCRHCGGNIAIDYDRDVKLNITRCIHIASEPSTAEKWTPTAARQSRRPDAISSTGNGRNGQVYARQLPATGAKTKASACQRRRHECNSSKCIRSRRSVGNSRSARAQSEKRKRQQHRCEEHQETEPDERKERPSKETAQGSADRSVRALNGRLGAATITAVHHLNGGRRWWHRCDRKCGDSDVNIDGSIGRGPNRWRRRSVCWPVQRTVHRSHIVCGAAGRGERWFRCITEFELNPESPLTIYYTLRCHITNTSDRKTVKP